MKNQNNFTMLATFGGGCFWCTQAIFQEVRGVINVTSGYSGGNIADYPSYHAKCSGMIGHAQVVQLEYDPNVISYEELLIIFMTTHDPTLLNQQGTDIGLQYRSIIFYENVKERAIIDIVIKELQPYFDKPIVTEVKRYERFFKAEERQQQYYQLNKQYGYCTTVMEPKMAQFRKQYAERLKPTA
ncbi:peptide-methionine (S)-S-oxide reductase MsrA [Maribacter sp. R77961]|uniref:peptide-methionine (S)-S-oxide reductase MsrA n=1 Tax=Maribacter sp. R77961 TaxID=3093871 RepID=UPI0037C95E5A